MPQMVICQQCCATLYEGEELKSPYEIVQGYNGRCPACGKKLSYMPMDVEIRLVNET